MAETAVILLAAGQSQRMGEANKLLLPVCGEPLLRRSAKMLASITAARVIVVLGHEADEVAASLADLDVVTTVNPAFEEGQRTSVFHGFVKAGMADRYMVVPGDMPRLTADDCAALITAHDTAPHGVVTVPVRLGTKGAERGNPIILGNTARHEIIAGGVNLGCRGLLDRNPELIHTYLTESDGFFVDIDTPEAYAAEAYAAETYATKTRLRPSSRSRPSTLTE